MTFLRDFYSAAKKFFGIDNDGRLLMDISDKFNTSEILGDEKDRYCPSHHLPHSLPIFQSPVCNEPCHVHKSELRNLHHIPFCRLSRCPNYEDMMKAREKYNKKG